MRIGQIAIDTTPLRTSKDFRLLFIGRVVTQAGNAIAMTAANWQIFGLTHSSLAVGLLTLADSVGMFAGLLVGGVLADHNDRRKVMLAARTPLVALAALLVLNSLLAHPLLWLIYVLVAGMGTLSGFASPASTAAIPAVISSDQMPAAAALSAMSGQLGTLGGPALAGILIAGPGLPVCYGIDTACLAIFGVTLYFLRPLPPSGGGIVPPGQHGATSRPGLRSLAEGLRYVLSNPVVAGMLAVDTSAMIFGMPAALFPAIARDHFHGGSATFGLLVAAPALGAIIGAVTSGWTGRLRRPGVVVIFAGLAWGAAIVGFGLSTSLILGLVFLALAGMSDLVSEVLRNSLLQIYTPDALRGRATSLYLAQVTTAPSIGNVEAGVVAQLVSTTFSVVSGGLICVAGALLLGVLNPALRRAKFSGPEPADAVSANDGPVDPDPTGGAPPDGQQVPA
ncbi:MAG TPA: MFS transporter [Streptosporangiaceae bacterium]|jgi:ENTS family enterobactin (siderophore) exporter